MALVEDLFFLVQIKDAAKRAGCGIVFVRSSEELTAQAATSVLAIIDLNAAALQPLAAIATAKSLGLETLAFVPHVQVELRQQALDAGADRVVARSNFARHLQTALEKLAAAR